MPTAEFHELYEALRVAQDARGIFAGVEWIDFERLIMLMGVNSMRADRGLSLLVLSDIERVEQMASGHSDYTKKFALYCSELVMREVGTIQP